MKIEEARQVYSINISILLKQIGKGNFYDVSYGTSKATVGA